MKRRFTKLTLTVILVAMLAVTATSNALASPYKHGDLVIVSPEQLERVREQIRGGASNATMGAANQGGYTLSGSIEENPHGCYGQTDNPHVSDDSGFDEVSVHARSACPHNYQVAFLWVQTRLYRETHCAWSTCLGSEPWGQVGTASGYDVYEVEANSRGSCLNSWYKGVSAHLMEDWDGTRYFSFTVRRAEVTGC